MDVCPVESIPQQTQQQWALKDIHALTPPSDGVKRNYQGLLESLNRYSIPPHEQYAIIRQSNFGQIGHPVWRGLYDMSTSNGKIKMPGRFLMSLG